MLNIVEAPPSRLWLRAHCAADLMTPDPIRVRADDSLRESVNLLVDKGLHAVPVIDEEGRAVGVLTAADVMARHPDDPMVSDYYQQSWTSLPEEEMRHGFQVEDADRTLVRERMNPVVYAVPPSATPERVLGDLLELKVHQLFVVNATGDLVGVISTLDVLRHLGDEPRAGESGSRAINLDAASAADLMTPNPISVSEDARLAEARDLLAEKEISGAPVIDAAGRPVGVVSRYDLLTHERERIHYLAPAGKQPAPDPTWVRDVMTPVVFGVPSEKSATQVIADMLTLRVHRIFVLDDSGVLIGVICASDILRRLHGQ